MQNLSRRQFLKLGVGAAAVIALPIPKFALAAAAPVRELAFYNTHTAEKLKLVYAEKGQYLPDALAELNRLLRDHRTNEVHPIDPALFDQLYQIQTRVETPGAYHIISGYRSPKSNNALRAHSKGVASKSQHLTGKAIDIRLPGKELSHLRKAALDLKAGGVGYYPGSDFVHLDTGRVRSWG